MQQQNLAPDITTALQDAGAYGFFTALAPSHQREYLTWIDSAKRPETRERRIQKMLHMLAEKQ